MKFIKSLLLVCALVVAASADAQVWRDGKKAPNTQSGASYTALSNDLHLIINASGTHTITLPAAAQNVGLVIFIKTLAAQTVVSATSNVVPIIGGSATTAILAATAGKWAVLVSDGTNWVIMASN